jgi:hypothetical protein
MGSLHDAHVDEDVAAVNAALEEGLKQKKKRPPILTFDEEKHRYTVDGEFVPSVTQIIQLQDPFEAGPWWGMRTGFAAIVRLLQSGGISYGALMQEDPDRLLKGGSITLEQAVVKAQLTCNHVKEERGDEGTAIHHAINTIAQTGSPPRLSDFDPELRGYIQAFSKWYVDQDPDIIWQELILGSREHRYAGRADIGLNVWDVEADQPGVSIEDFKTNAKLLENGKRLEVYKKWHLQGRGYLTAYNEMLQWEPAGSPRCIRAATVVLHVSGDYYRETCLCPEPRWLKAVELWWENEPFLDELAKRHNKSGKRRKR